ncbi:Vegetative incompatibility protein HET-E-1 [Purpureocillium lavendulum]|uniref:Vegetative incompatibility protein HET-E-1 n=1 Tax=Purpureocillium lavendulum TaxID=1247861 RepID=A0AB34FEG0_9HYPO|nr:Vegetative incompatibility protein HET-E-1 [Purpureocillium lavendulum]
MAQSQYDNESAYSEPTQVENRTPPPEVRATEPERGAAAVAASSADEAHRLIHDRNLWVLGLPLHVTEADVRSLFQEYSGTDVAIQMSGFDVNGMYNIAYVWMSSVAEARRAYSQLKGRRLEKDGNAYTLQIRQANQSAGARHQRRRDSADRFAGGLLPPACSSNNDQSPHGPWQGGRARRRGGPGYHSRRWSGGSRNARHVW